MKRTKKYFGLDVHQATTAIAVLDERGRVLSRSVLPTDAGPLVEFFRGMRGTILVAFEEGSEDDCDRGGEESGISHAETLIDGHAGIKAERADHHASEIAPVGPAELEMRAPLTRATARPICSPARV